MKKSLLVNSALFCLLLTSVTGCNTNNNANTFKIRFINTDGTVIQSEDLLEGEIPEVKVNTNVNSNYFIKWTPEISEVNKNQDYYATLVEKKADNDTDFDGLVDTIDPEPANNYHKNVSFITAAKKGFNLDLRIDYRWLLDSSNTTYNSDIAKLAAAINIGKADFFDGIASEGKIDFYKNRLGCDDLVNIELDKSYYKDEDEADIVGGYLGHHEVIRDDKKYDVIFITIKGTRSENPEEWASNFDVGYDGANYLDKTGTHSEWKDRNYHKGFAVAAERWLHNIKEPVEKGSTETKSDAVDFVKKHSKNNNTVILVTGHSRGAAVAQIVGEYFENSFVKDNPGIAQPKVFTYTFASPNMRNTDSKIKSDTIFNIINNDDIVPMIPLNQWGMSRIGTDVITKSVKSDLSARFKEVIGKDYECLINPLNVLNELKGSRSNIYEVDKSNKDNLAKTEKFLIKRKAEDRIDDIKNIVKNDFKLNEKFFDFGIDDEKAEDNSLFYRLNVYNCKGTLFQILQNILTGKYGATNELQSLSDIIKLITNLSFVLNPVYKKLLIDFVLKTGIINSKLKVCPNTISYPHDMASYILLVDKK